LLMVELVEVLEVVLVRADLVVVVVPVIAVQVEAVVIQEVLVIAVVGPMVDILIIMLQQIRQVAYRILCMEK